MSWADERRIKWAGIKRLDRLYQLTKALDEFAVPELTVKVATLLLGPSPKNPFVSLTHSDTTWLPEVIHILVQSLVENHPSPHDILAQLTEGVPDWATAAHEVRDVRHAWKAAEIVMAAANADLPSRETARTAFVECVSELAEAVLNAGSADEISQVADDLEPLVHELDGHLQFDLHRLRDAEEEARRREEASGDDEVQLAANYSDRASVGGGRFDIVGLFEELVHQLTEESIGSETAGI